MNHKSNLWRVPASNHPSQKLLCLYTGLVWAGHTGNCLGPPIICKWKDEVHQRTIWVWLSAETESAVCFTSWGWTHTLSHTHIETHLHTQLISAWTAVYLVLCNLIDPIISHVESVLKSSPSHRRSWTGVVLIAVLIIYQVGTQKKNSSEFWFCAPIKDGKRSLFT